jgi:hydrophobe/amphiphile efflux-1 (HAE1) family protein
MFARFFIDRPVFAMVLSILIVLGGSAAIWVLPIEQYPQVVPPQITISAVYPGASAETVARSVAAPIEEQLSGIKGLLYTRSQANNDGTLAISATFEIGTDQDIAAVEVQNRLSIAQPSLPAEVVRNGLTVTKASSSILSVITLESTTPQYDDTFLADYVTVNVLDAIKRVPGVGDAQVFGKSAMRIWVDPDRLALKGMTMSDVANAIREQNAVFAVGAIGQRPDTGSVLTVPAITRGRFVRPEEYENIILRAGNNGSMVRLKDVAKVQTGPDSYDLYARHNGAPTAAMLVNAQVGANALHTMFGIRKTMEDLAKTFPAGVTFSTPVDTTTFVERSIDEVATTLLAAVGLVILVVFVFLQSWRATLIPLLAVPVAIVGAFAGIMAFGFTINTLTLFGVVLAIGIVVDDAIVVVENVERIMHEEHLPPREATIKAMGQVTGPVITIVLVLVAVFGPVAFLGGFTGQLYRQFAVTIALSVTISGFVALTLTPALCTLLLKRTDRHPFILFRMFDAGFGGVTKAFTVGVRQAIKHSLVALAVFGVLGMFTFKLFTSLPTGLVPEEDQGMFFASVMLPEGASLQRTDALVKQVEKYLQAQPAIEDVVSVCGMDMLGGGARNSNAATFFVNLKPQAQRRTAGMGVQDVVKATMAHFHGNPDGNVLAFNMPPIFGLGMMSGFEMQLQSRGGGSITELADTANNLIAKLGDTGRVLAPYSTLRVTQPQLYVDPDIELAKAHGVPLNEVFDTLQAYLGSLYVNDFDKFGRIWHVQLQSEAQYRRDPHGLDRFFVRNATGQMVPMSAIVRTRFQAGPNAVVRFNGFPAVTITGMVVPGVASGTVMADIEKIASELPEGYAVEWSGASYQEAKTSNQAPYIMGFGMAIVFLVLAAQYEMWTLPLAVLLAVPIAVMGALIAAIARGLMQDVYFQVGLLTLVGLSAKNAILIVEFALTRHRAGVPVRQAAIEAARLRFRPIVMTSLAFILGALPLAISTGAGAGARHSIGTGVIGGMLASTFLAMIFVPVFFVILVGAAEAVARWRKPRSIPSDAYPPPLPLLIATADQAREGGKESAN